MTDRLSLFKELSVLLVAEPRLANSTVERHLATLTSHVGEAAVESLLARFEAIKAAGGDLNSGLADQIFGDAALAPTAKSALSLWFAGVPDVTVTPPGPATGMDYAEALMWTALGAHPAAYSDGYYGHWRYPPDTGI